MLVCVSGRFLSVCGTSERLIRDPTLFSQPLLPTVKRRARAPTLSPKTFGHTPEQKAPENVHTAIMCHVPCAWRRSRPSSAAFTVRIPERPHRSHLRPGRGHAFVSKILSHLIYRIRFMTGRWGWGGWLVGSWLGNTAVWFYVGGVGARGS